MDVSIHLGPHRCAVTSFHRFLQSRRVALSDAGVAVWTPFQTRSGLFDPSRRKTAGRDRRQRRIALAMDVVRLQGYRRLILSDPNWLGCPGANKHTAGFYLQARESLLNLRRGLARPPQRICLAVRGQDRFWASVLSQKLRAGHQLPPKTLLTQLAVNSRGWRDVVIDIAAVFPQSEILVWPFERFAGRPETKLGFLTNGLTLPAGAEDRRITAASLDKSCLRHLLAGRGGSRPVPFSLWGEGSWMPFDVDQQAQLRARYASDLKWLRDGADSLARFVEAPDPLTETFTLGRFRSVQATPSQKETTL